MTTVPERAYYGCLEEWFKTARGANNLDNIIITDYGRIKGWR